MDTSQYLNQWVTQKGKYNKRDLILYALGIGAYDLKYAYENDSDFAAFPTYFKGDSEDVVSFPSPAISSTNGIYREGPALPPLPGIKVGLDGERYVEMIRPLDVEGGEVTFKSRLIGIHKRGTGASVETETIISDAKGPLYRLVSGAFLVGAKDFKDSGTSNSEAVPIPKRNPDKEVEVKVPETATLLYRLSGDYNPLHVEEGLAQMSGFEAPINHGLCSLGMTCHQVIKHMLDNDPAQFKAIKARFASPVLPGQTIVVKMWREKDRVIFTTTVKETGKVCINNSYVLVNAGAKL